MNRAIKKGVSYLVLIAFAAMILAGGLSLAPNSAVQGATNLALNKTATASSYNLSTETPAKAVDGLATSKWCATNTGAKWLSIDLGASYSINRWVVKHAGGCGGGNLLQHQGFQTAEER